MRSLTVLFLLTFSLNASAGLFSNNNEDVQKAMKSYVENMIKNSSFMPVVYKGKVLKLNVAKSKKYPDGFHSGVKNKGDLFVSCADFIDQKGNKYDIDFLVNRSDDKYAVVQPIVHSINGEKNPYDLSH